LWLIDSGGDGVQVLLGIVVGEGLASDAVVLTLFFVQLVGIARILP
jgi:hypothetical protein